MELQDGSEMRPRRAWQAAIDARLVARLVRPMQPGLIGMGLARRIVGGVEAMAGRLGLLARFSRGVRGQGAKDSPTIVHALWPRTPREASAAERRGTVDRVDVRDAAPRAAVRPVVSARVVEAERLHERLTERSTAPLAETTLVERVAAGTALSRVAAVSAGATASALMSRGVAAAHAPTGAARLAAISTRPTDCTSGVSHRLSGKGSTGDHSVR